MPIEETIKALAELKKEGKIGGIQLSEVKAETIRRAASVAQIDIVKAEISLWATEVFENVVAETCAELGIVMEAHSPLGVGMLTGRLKSPDDMPAHDYHKIMFPWFQPENFKINLVLVSKLNQLAEVKKCTMPQLALSWIKAQSRNEGMPVIVPVPGARSEDRVLENVAEVELSATDLEEIMTILESFPVAGDRYPLVLLNWPSIRLDGF